MNYRLVAQLLGLLLAVIGGVLVLIAAWAFSQWRWAGDQAVELPAALALIMTAAVGILGGGLVWLVARGTESHLGRREALLLVALTWIVGAAMAGAPFYVWAHLAAYEPGAEQFRSAVDCYFEAMSGLTTTGATILTDIEAVPASLLLWRAVTQWLGGLGIVVLFVAVLPSLGVGGKRLFRIEAPGPDSEGVRPQIRDTARVLWYIYLGLTVAEILALRIVGRMSLFDSICHTFGTLATGGFSVRNESIGAYDATAVRVIIVVFMVLAGTNFGLYYQLIRRRWQSVLRDVELRVYLIVLIVGAFLVIGSLWASNDPIFMTGREVVHSDLAASVGEGIFTTVAIQTGTGFCTSDFNRWPFLAQGVLILLMFVGGCAGSTSGGIKVIRVWITFKVMIAELERAFRPNVIRPVRVAGTTIDPELKLGAVAYLAGIIVLFVLGAGSLMLLESLNGTACDFTSAATASIATLCTIGPGLARVGAVENYAWFSDASKMVLCLLMALGRLELFAILVLFTPRFWRGD